MHRPQASKTKPVAYARSWFPGTNGMTGITASPKPSADQVFNAEGRDCDGEEEAA